MGLGAPQGYSHGITPDTGTLPGRIIENQQFGKELIFKGGTALSRAYGLERFSEDLDFTLSHAVEIKPVLEKGIKQFYLQVEIVEEKPPQGLGFTLRIQGPLYNGVRHSLCKIELDFSLRENVIMEPKTITLGKLLPELPAFDVLVMAAEEILAEKVRAILTRTKARDVYDLWFLLQRGTNVDSAMIQEKIHYYQQEYRVADLKKKLNFHQEIWETELTPLLLNVPAFSDVKKLILERMPARQQVLKKKREISI